MADGLDLVKLFLRLSNLSDEDDVTIIAGRHVKIRSDTYRLRNSKDLMLLVNKDRTIHSLYQS